MASAMVVRRARLRVFRTYLDPVFVNMAIAWVLEVSVMEIILMTFMLYGSMSAVRTVDMRVPFVSSVFGANSSAPSVFESSLG